MTAVHRLQTLQQQAGTILINRGYEPVIVTNLIRHSRYIPYNLTACREYDDGTVDAVTVKLKISLHPIRSLDEAAVFCRDEIRCMKKVFENAPEGIKISRLEVWISIPSDQFQEFEITKDGIVEILSPEEIAEQTGGAA